MSGEWDVVSSGSADAAPAENDWDVLSAAPTDPNAATIGDRSPVTVGSLFRHPIASLSALASRFPEVAADTYRHGTLGGSAANLAADAAIRATQGDRALAQTKSIEMDARPDRPKSGVEHVSDFLAGIVGSAPSPESWVSAPGKLAIAGRPILSRILRNALGGAVVSGATDPAVQAANVKRGLQDKYDPWQTVSSVALGAGAGGAFGAAHGVAEHLGARAEARAAEREAALQGDDPWAVVGKPNPLDIGAKIRDFQSQWRDAQLMEGRARPSVDDVWGRLEKQESGGDQRAVSPAGAFGVAQLMPDTAAAVARRLGRPELADLAATHTPAGEAANRMLGRAYYGELLDQFGGDHTLAAAAYNAGPGRVKAWVKAFGDPREIGSQAFVDKIPFPETRDYVEKVVLGSGNGVEALPLATEARAPEMVTAEPREAPAPGFEMNDDGTVRLVDQAPAEEPIPIPARPTQERTAADEPPAEPDLTDRALEVIRNGETVKVDEGPTLMQFLASKGGVKDEGGELSSFGAEGWHKERPFQRRFVNDKGMTLEDAAVMAQEHGYLPERVGEGDTRAQPEDLINAIREEIAGRPSYARDDHANAQLEAHVRDLEEQLHHVGLDPNELTNAQIRQALAEYWASPHHGDLETVHQPPPNAYGAAPDRAMAEELFAQRLPGGRDGQPPEVLASLKGGLVGQQKLRAIPAPDLQNIPKIEGLADLAKKLIDTLDLTRRQGRMSLRGALGTYNRKSGVIRTLGVPDVEVLAHEAGHALEFTHRLPTLLKAMKQYSNLLKALDYDPKAARRHEGFAEFLRWYMTNPHYAQQVAPGFYQAFENALLKDAPDVLTSMQQIQQAYNQYMISPSASVVASMVIPSPKQSGFSQLQALAQRKGMRAAVQEVFSEIYRGMVDKLNPLNQAVETLKEIKARNTGKSDELRVDEDPYKIARMSVAANSAAWMDLMHGVHGYHELEPTEGTSLAEALETALGRKFGKWDEHAYQAFNDYLVARRMVQEHLRYQRGELEQEPVLPFEVWNQAVEDFGKAYPQFDKAASQVYDFANAMWQKRRDAGLITPQEYESGIADHPDYVPLQRDVSDKAGGLGGAQGAPGTKFAGGVKRFVGTSERPFINPVDSMVQEAFRLNRMIQRNDAVNALLKLAEEAGPDGGRIAERIPASEIKATQVGVKEVLENAINQGALSHRDELVISDALADLDPDLEPSSKIYRRSDISEKGEPIVYAWQNGDRIPVRLPDGKWGRHMLEALTMADKPIKSPFLDILSWPARMLRMGVTAHPQFFLANTIRDQMTAAFLTDVGYVPFRDQLMGLAHEASQSEQTRRYNVVGGAIGGAQTAAEHEARANREFQHLNRMGYPIKRFMSLKGVMQATELSETGTRLGIFKNAYDRGIEAGLSEWDAAREAAFVARDYMDFDRRGGWGTMQVAQRIIPFLNANIQALDKSRRVGQNIMKAPQVIRALTGGPPVTDAEKRQFVHAMKLWGAMSGMAAGAVALRALYKDDPEYQEVADYVRDTHWVIPLPNGELAVVPKPFELAALSNAAERAYEGVALKDSSAWARLAGGEKQLFVPELNIPFLSTPFQLAKNRDNFGVPIVPTRTLNAEPRDRAGEHNTAIAKWIGHQLNWSPAQIDFVARSGFGSIGKDVWGGLDSALRAAGLSHQEAPIDRPLTNTFVAGRFIKDWTRGSTSSKGFWDLMADDDGKWANSLRSIQLLTNGGDVKEAAARINKMDGPQRAYVLTSLMGKGDDKLLHPMIRGSKVIGVVSGLISDLRDGNVRGPDLQPVELTPHERMMAVEGLARYQTAEMRNALIQAGAKGWENKEPMDKAKYLAMVPASIRQTLALRLGVELKNPALAVDETWAGPWKAMQDFAAKPMDADKLEAVLAAKGMSGRAADMKVLRQTTPVH